MLCSGHVCVLICTHYWPVCLPSQPKPKVHANVCAALQFFRSIDCQSVCNFPEDNQAAMARGLETGKLRTVDKSCHTAYLHAIRQAEHFLYVENQYFLGSSNLWKSKVGPFIWKYVFQSNVVLC